MTTAELAIGVIAAVRSGDLDALQRLVDEHPGLASSRPRGPRRGSHATACGYRLAWFLSKPPETAQLLIGAGADVDSRGDDQEHGETPLHWVASSDDAAVAAVLIDAGANLDMPNGSIGTPLANAVGYACWNVARLLVARGATVGTLWEAAALGLLERLEELIADVSISTPENISQAFPHACAGGQRRAAERLLGLGADLNGVPDYAEKTPLDVAGGGGTQDSNVVEWLKQLGARSTGSGTAGGSYG